MAEPVINKTMDFTDLNAQSAIAIIQEINQLIALLQRRGLKISSWYGRFDLKSHPNFTERINRGYGYNQPETTIEDVNFPWFLYWEIVWVILHGGFNQHQKVLDLGGSSSLFSYYLAWKGCEVVTIDVQKKLVDNGNAVANQMNWKLKNCLMDMQDVHFQSSFDHVTSICVYEHLPLNKRIKVNAKIKRLLRDGGRFSITFDYRNPSKFVCINSPDDVEKQFIKPSGLTVRGNKAYFDNRKNYLLHPFYYNKIGKVLPFKIHAVLTGQFSPREFLRTKKVNDYTFGALFLEK